MNKYSLIFVLLSFLFINNCEQLISHESDNFIPPKPEYNSDQSKLSVIKLLNWYRQQSLPTVINKSQITPGENFGVRYESPLNANCLKHLQYLKLNDIFTHTEDVNLSGYSPEGHDSGIKSNLAQNVKNVFESVELWMNSLYHRIPLLEPALESVGFAYLENADNSKGLVAMDVVSGLNGIINHPGAPILFPFKGQKDVASSFNILEEPNPLPNGWKIPSGSFLTAMFDTNDIINADSISVRFDRVSFNGLVPIDKENLQLVVSEDLKNVIYIVHKFELEPDTSFQVEMELKVNGNFRNYFWEFTTIS